MFRLTLAQSFFPCLWQSTRFSYWHTAAGSDMLIANLKFRRTIAVISYERRGVSNDQPTRLFVQHSAETKIRENTKAHYYKLFSEESTGETCTNLQKVQKCQKVFIGLSYISLTNINTIGSWCTLVFTPSHKLTRCWIDFVQISDLSRYFIVL